VQLLGIGEAGHIGFNEPLSALMSRTREKALTPVTRQQNAAIGGDSDKVPKRAVTTIIIGLVPDHRPSFAVGHNRPRRLFVGCSKN
jgi:6-phosphogluconolactonase/glucosamine-6-phosphate isomerase/deaminase